MKEELKPIISFKKIIKFQEGILDDLYNVFGAHKIKHDKKDGIRFTVWAPNAKSVYLTGSFNNWDGTSHPLNNVYDSGIWEIFVEGLGFNALYKYEIVSKEDEVLIKTDPHSFLTELRPHNSSIIFDINSFKWTDRAWIKKREGLSLKRPINIYEVHLASWKKKNKKRFSNYRELAHDLSKYCKEMGYTHIELMPITEHPLDDSWGYQVTGFYAITSRYGTPKDFQYFVNYMHANGIGVILDWVPAHFPIDSFSLNKFDGTYLYEDVDLGLHPHWSTSFFDYSQKSIKNFLMSSALYYFDKMHIDGIRVDAVTSMLYLDYGKKKGEWKPNKYGGRENLGAIEFIKDLNARVHKLFPGALMIAEEATTFKGVTDGKVLGFDLKWNMGWMNDTFKYFKTKPKERSKKQNDLTFSLTYSFSEKYILALSHDEVVHQKGSLLNKIPTAKDEKYANLRALYSYLICHPGKKLTFMGTEIASIKEWDFEGELSWELLKDQKHNSFHQFVKDLNQLYLKKEELWSDDFTFEGYEWIDFSDKKNSMISYIRKSLKKELLCLHNFSKNFLKSYFLKLKNISKIFELFNSDEKKYGGSGKINREIAFDMEGLYFDIAPFTTIIFEVDRDK